MQSLHKDYTIETVEEDDEIVAWEESFVVEDSLNNVEMGLTNDSPDIWIEGPEKQEKS